MTRRFQFSLRALLVVMSVVAIVCAIWVNLPAAVRVAIITGACSLFWWMFDLELIWALLPPYGDPTKQDGQRYKVKWRRRGEKTSRE